MDQAKVRPLAAETEASPPPRWRRAGVLTAATLLLVMVVATRERPAETPRQPEQVVRAFVAALDGGDAAAASSLLAAVGSPVVLPALGSAISPGEEPTDAIAFVAEVTRLEVGDCTSRLRPGWAVGAATVSCSMVVASDYREALGLHEVAGSLRATVLGDRIGSLATTIDDRFAAFSPYCAWALATDPELAAALFDARCRPVESAETAEDHVALAARYAEEGGAGPVEVVDAFARLHNEGADPVALFRDRFRVATFPGILVAFPQWPFPELDEYLRWSAAVYDIDLGRCLPDRRGGALVAVDCEEARLTGPLPTALGLGAVVTPIRFFVTEGQIVGVSGRSPAALIDAFAARCGDAEVAAFLAAGCTPRYDEAAGRGLVAVLDRAP